MKVYIKSMWTNGLVFEGPEEEAKEVYEVLTKYHEYDYNTTIRLEENETPIYKDLTDFYSVFEHKATLRNIKGNK